MFKDRMDIDLYQNNIRLILTHARDSFQNQLDSAEKLNADDLSREMVKFLCNESSKRVFKVTKRKAQIRAIELMEEVGIANARERYRQYPFEFSGGMRQRIVIAIALAANPDILICDEPTTALDVTIQAQILELINKLKAERQLSIIFITHDLGVVANMADKIAVMYAGKIVEYGTANDVFYDPRHPYTWALLSSMPDLDTKEKLDAIPGTPPNMIFPPKGDAFAERNKYAMQIDFEEQPPMFKVSDTHYAATWLMHPNAPKVEPPKIVTDRIARMKKLNEESRGDSNE
ncbi:MAG: ABC transporter ATP-binding protein [Oscillospiraceae bacterium]|nr:ABC transporter ATP-binding protein [Oscillospiraceae bacterium]